ncbi:GNAT superfamily N-acetyltransferase [Actinoplanes octamycinicus]|uniref:GNAT superfamily N-acetyltransferase n=1 Tax=Actinoplanes octamycinicus TaxID=135948 RepID=A0A7W7H018_9ACTN|nr:GNAT family N-acetyltransferase [Actinoplanes octamycinicus]MBB4741443.1 GNAT superfamily N-acetyltransferase [Actinoplanes octamycinicus]GIE62760.1 N-acetyltransferase [Actinoplanes octamycinicus]
MEITTWYLEQTDAALIKKGGEPTVPVDVVRAEIPSPELSRFLYTAVGGDWTWTDRLPWTWQQWQDHLDRPGVETWVAYVRGTPAGYIELDGSQPGAVEVTYFGLLPQFAGKRIGGFLLTTALEKAWSLRTRWPDLAPVERVWLHTCSLDGPTALANYQARGLTIYRTETEPAPTTLPTDPPGPWPGAHRPR